VVGTSEYSAFNDDPVWFSDAFGDSSRPGFLGGTADFLAGGWGSVKGDAKGLWTFATSDAWKSKTWSEMGKNVAALSIGAGGGNPVAGTFALAAIDEKLGTNLLQRNASMNTQVSAAIKDIPNMNAKDWGGFVGHVAFALVGTKGASLAGKGLGALNELAATKYLSMTGDLSAFEKVEGFSLRLGSKDFIYHNSLDAAKASRWSTPTLFSSSSQAVGDLALGYPGSTNTALVRYGSRNFGVFVKGTAASQSSTLGGGTQLLKTPFTLKTSVGWNEFIHFK